MSDIAHARRGSQQARCAPTAGLSTDGFRDRIESELGRQLVHRNASAPHAITSLTAAGVAIAEVLPRDHTPATRKR